jgi:hypothetical protein
MQRPFNLLLRNNTKRNLLLHRHNPPQGLGHVPRLSIMVLSRVSRLIPRLRNPSMAQTRVLPRKPVMPHLIHLQ